MALPDADTLDLRPSPGRIALAIAVIALVVALAVLGQDVVSKINNLATANADNLQWNLSQVEVEFLRFEEAVENAQHHDGSPADVRRRFNVLFSRVGTIQTGDVYGNVRETPDFAGTLARIGAFLDRNVALIDGGDETLRAGLPQLAEEAETLQPHVRVLALKGISVFARLSDLRRSTVAETLILAAGLALTLVIVLLFGLGILFRIHRRGERRAMEVQAATSRLRAMVSTSLDAIVVADRDGVVLDFNGAAEAIFGYTRAEVLGRRTFDVIVPEHRRQIGEAILARYRQTGEHPAIGKGQYETEVRRKNGEVFPVEVSVDTADSEDGEIFIAYIRDISDRKANELALLAARDEALAGEKAKAELIAVMSHEMRTPLNGLLGTLDVLKTTELDERQRNYVRIMEGSGQHLLAHVNDVLDISRLDSGRVEIATAPFDLPALLGEIVESQRAVAAKANNRLRLAGLPVGMLMVTGDAARLRQILLNLVGNALKFTRDGEVTVDVARGRDPDQIVFSIADTGVGIAENQLERVFEDFVTIDTTYDREAEGTGLGLPIARRLAHAMGGEIGVESEPGEGSLFWVRLPLPPARVTATPPPPAVRAKEIAPTTSDARHILLVEDNEVNRFVAREMLEGLGYSVTEAHDGHEGVLRATEIPFDLIFMDISMPRMDGLTATRMIRSTGASRRARIIALTAHALPAEIEKFREAGMDATLIKPITRASLQAAIAAPAGIDDGVQKTSSGFDREAVNDLKRAVGADKAAGLVRTFVSEADGLFAIPVEGRLAQSDLEAYRAAVHKVAGSAAVLGAAGLNAGLARLEGLIKQDRRADIPSAHEDARATWEATRPLMTVDETDSAVG